MKKNLLLLFIFLALTAGAVLFLLPKESKANLDSFAQCLSSKGAVMYGAYWCSHCQNEKNAFGESFKFVNYVECTEKPNDCLAKGIDGYPTWIFPDGRKLVGEQGITKLQEASGCPL
ncbi:MAG: hypothetical protein WD889_01385 [Candidatus Colwellbacteria bacterium]